MSGITINIVRLGSGEEAVELPEGSTYGDVIEKLKEQGQSNVTLQNRGRNLEDIKDQPVQPNDRVQAVPRQYKQG